MVKYENECVGCPPNMGCMGSACPNKNVAHYYCDECGDEIYGEVYQDEGDDLCYKCYSVWKGEDDEI